MQEVFLTDRQVMQPVCNLRSLELGVGFSTSFFCFPLSFCFSFSFSLSPAMRVMHIEKKGFGANK